MVNKFEIEVDKYNNSIKNEVDKFLGMTGNIISLDFYKIWEIMFMFDLFDVNNIQTAHFLEDGSNIQSVMYFREKFYNTTDKYYHIKYDTFKSNNFFEENDKKIIRTSIENIKDKVDFITIGSGITYQNDNENTIEQEYHNQLFMNIINMVRIQRKGGASIIKIFETYTDVTAKIISILISLYDKVFLMKPMTSKPEQSEKYIICNGFKLSDVSGVLKKLEKIKDIMMENPKLKLCDLFIDYEIDKRLKIRLIKINQLVSNMVFKSLGEIVNFINNQDYYGDTYENYRAEQMEANNFWVETFLPDPKNFKEIKKKIIEASVLTNKINVDDAINLEKVLL